MGFHCDRKQLLETVKRALREDLGCGDITSRLLIPKNLQARGVFVSHARGIFAGGPVLKAIAVCAGFRVRLLKKDGARIAQGERLAEIRGSARAALAVERVALNFLQRLSGIATLTRSFVEAVAGSGAKILDTRKTTPGLRFLEKYAVSVGGGMNHRSALSDMAFVKDNHLNILGERLTARKLFSIKESKRRLRGKRLIVEARNLGEAMLALTARADIILLDNMTLPSLRRALRTIRKISPKTQIEVSGGVTLKSVRRLSALGVERISVGALTHSAPALDMSLEISPLRGAIHPLN